MPLHSRFTIANTLSKEKNRPIVFICHSLGGIVAKKVSMNAELKLLISVDVYGNVGAAA